MLFNSLDFALFLPIVFILFWFVCNRSLKLQNILILVASYVFYAWWDWHFLFLIILSTVIDYTIGLRLENTYILSKRKALLFLSLATNLGILCYFKYANFFIENFVDAFAFFGYKLSSTSLNVILPVGISFYTFQTLSYTIDVFNKKLEAEKNLISFAAFVSFFPQLVAGPIERATNLLPQFRLEKQFTYQKASEGLKQMLWGLFKKMVIADTCALHVNEIFNNYSDYNPSTLVLGAVLFAFQIYGDFSGYSDIAIGIAKLFGFDLMKNFSFPYFSRDIAEFWRKWHISLSTWFRDYLYIPLGGSKGSTSKKVRNVFIIFIVSGFWHGANWTFIAWGLLNALYFLPLMLLNKNRKNLDATANNRLLPSPKEIIQIGITFSLTTLAWIFFRAENITIAFDYIISIFSKELFSLPEIRPKHLILLLLFFNIIEWIGRKEDYAIAGLFKNNKVFRWGFYYLVLFLTLYFMQTNENEFIYFQF